MTELSATGNDRITMGANMSPFDQVSVEIADLYEEARNWADGTPIQSDEQHHAVTALYDALHDAGKRADELRVKEVEPLDEAKEAIQARYHPLIGDTKAGKGKVVIGKEALGKLLSDWRAAKAKEKAEAAERARKDAEQERAKAEAAIRASSGDLEARERAEEMLALADEADRYASRQQKRAETGNKLRTVYVAELMDLHAAIKHYWGENTAPFEELVTTLAAADVRSGKRSIPGFEIKEKKKAI